MNDEQITETLESLPRQHADANFTASVMARLDEPPKPFFALPRTILAPTLAFLFLALCLSALGLGWQQWQHRRDSRIANARFELLLAEKQALEAELESLRRLASEASLVYLGGDEKMDLVLDLARLQRRGGPQASFEHAGPRPAHLQNDRNDPRANQRFSARNVVY